MMLESKRKILIGAGVLLFGFYPLEDPNRSIIVEKVNNMLIFYMKGYPSGVWGSPADNGHSLDTPEVI